jgi:S-DNA-T family DNA segregation ATPase FtsK/SpoIIIE
MNKDRKALPANNTESKWEYIQPRLHEGLFIAVVALCLYFFLSLVTYNAQDPGWSHTGNAALIHNAAGRSGAWIADVLYSLIGYTAFLIPLMLGFRAWVLFKQRYSGEIHFDWVTISIRIIGFLLVVIGFTGLLSLQGPSVNESLPFGYGGLLGKTLAEGAYQSFNIIGGRLILTSVLLFGMTIFTDLSWLRLMDLLGKLSIQFFDKSRRTFKLLIAKWKERKQQRLEQDSLNDIQQKRQLITENKRVAIEKHKPIKIEPVVTKIEVSDRVEREKQVSLFDDGPVTGDIPPLSLLNDGEGPSDKGFSKEALEAMSRLLEIKLKDFNIVAEVVAVYPGPVITRFEIQPAAGIKVSKISGLAKDLARSLAVISVRVVEVIPGKTVIGIEVPNEHREIVYLTQVLTSKVFADAKSPLTLALGNDISGVPICADLAKMPHLLVAGTTGSGKSVGVNAMLLSLLFKATPKELRLLLIDPKMLELSVYEGIPHLLTPVITDMKDAANGLRWCVGEMERRYKLMAALGVRNLAGYNKKIEEAAKSGEPILDPLWVPEVEFVAGEDVAPAPELETLPYIVVVIDEFADMMMIVGKKVEELIARIAQKARAAGIHLILATQRPSVDVITGLIKANVPTRIGFQVSSKIDSRTILDQGGAEQLLGHGDMLYLPPGSSIPVRVHGAFVADEEVHRVAANWKKRGKPAYIDGLLEDGSSENIPGIASAEGDGGDDENDPLFDEAVCFVTETRKVSISSVQRKLRIGYNRAARLVEAMEAAGVVSSAGHNGAREVLAPPPPER